MSPTRSRPLTQPPEVRVRRAALVRVLDRETRAPLGAAQLAAVADLAARLGVERRAIEHHLAALAGARATRRCWPSRSSASTRPSPSTRLVAAEFAALGELAPPARRSTPKRLAARARSRCACISRS